MRKRPKPDVFFGTELKLAHIPHHLQLLIDFKSELSERALWFLYAFLFRECSVDTYL